MAVFTGNVLYLDTMIPYAVDIALARTYASLDGRVSLKHGEMIARHFSPLGVPLGVDGGDPFGYTGEWQNSTVELLYLRARLCR